LRKKEGKNDLQLKGERAGEILGLSFPVPEKKHKEVRALNG